MNLLFTKASDRDDWKNADRRLVAIVSIAWDFLSRRFGVRELVVTSFYRPDDRSSAHAWFRGVDLRSRSLPPGAAGALAAYLNDLFVYSNAAGKADHHLAIFGDIDPTGRHDDHVHLGVPPEGELIFLRAT